MKISSENMDSFPYRMEEKKANEIQQTNKYELHSNWK